jgi:hypothetical protein
MAPKKKRTVCEPKAKFTATIPLPKIKGAGKYFQDFWKKIKPNGSTLSVKNFSLFINAENEEMLANIRATIETEMKKFIERNRSLTKIWPKTKNSRRIIDQRKHQELISHDIIRRARFRDCQHSKHVNQFLRNKRRHWNRIKMVWKQWYINRRKLNTKFKAINKYVGTLIRQRHREVSFNKQVKRSKFEYYQQKILGRKRDRLKEKRVYRAKLRNKRRKRKDASKYNRILNEHSGTASGVSKLKFITADAAKTMMFHLKNKKESHLAMISRGSLGGEYEFPLFPWVDTIPIDSKNFVIRYYNQQIFIYTASIGTNRPLKQNLVHAFSTFNGNVIKLNRHTEYTRFSPIKQPSHIINKDENFSRKKKPEASKKALPLVSAVRMSANDHISAPVQVKPKKSSQRRHVKTATKH